MLGALVLTTYNDPSWVMRDADSGIGGIHVLSTFASGAVGIDPQIFGLDVHFNAVVDFGRDERAG